MRKNLVINIIAVGFCGLIAQVLLLRELLVSFQGNELLIGLILANWLAMEAVGAYLAGKFGARLRSLREVIIFTQAIFCLGLPLSVYLARILKLSLGGSTAQMTGMGEAMLISGLTLFIPAVSHGLIFVFLVEFVKRELPRRFNSPLRVYAWEAVGTAFAGLIFTFILLECLMPFQIAFFTALVGVFTAFLGLNGYLPKRSKMLLVVCFAALLYPASRSSLLEDISIKQQYCLGSVAEFRDSAYGRIMLVKDKSERTIFYNGMPIISLPDYMDESYSDEFANFTILAHPRPEKILCISGGLNGLLDKILKYRVPKVDYIEPDQLLIKMARYAASESPKNNSADRRLNIINDDARRYLRCFHDKYDIIIIGLTRPQDLATNRYFSLEFFRLARSCLNEGGILSLSLDGSPNYMGLELRDINSAVSSALAKAFKYIRAIPGERNIYLASDSQGLAQISADLFSGRLAKAGVSSPLLLEPFLEYKLDKKRQAEFRKELEGAPKNINYDLRPVAAYSSFKYTNKKFFPQLSKAMRFLFKPYLAFIFFILVLGSLIFLVRKYKENLCIAYSIFSTGFFAMSVNLIMIFAYQVYCANLYKQLGLLIALFMSGVCLAGLYLSASKIRASRRLFLISEAAIIAYIVFMIASFACLESFGQFFLGLQFFCCGALIGAQFPLATGLFKSDSSSWSIGALYAADLLGALLAGIFGALFLIPALGVINSCLVILSLKLVSICLFLSCSKKI